MRNLIYCRVSSDKQDTETQIELCKEIAKKNGKQPLIFIDEGVSSSIPMEKRPQLQKLLDEIYEGDLIIVYDIDRIGRDIVEGILIYREIKRLGANITSVTDSHCDNEFIINIKFSMAQEEKRRIKERTKDKLRTKQKNFEKSGHVWYGYMLDDKIIQTNENSRCYGKPYKLIPNPEEQEIISMMKSLYSGGQNFSDITRYLNSEGYRTREGKEFLKNTVRRILLRELTHPALEAKRAEWILAAI